MNMHHTWVNGYFYSYVYLKITLTDLTEKSAKGMECGQTDLVLGTGGVKIKTRNRPLSARGKIS